MSNSETVKMFLLGVVATLLVILTLRDHSLNAADGGSAGGLIALTAQVGMNGKNTALFLIDTSNKYVAYYVADDASKFTMVAARNFGYDLGINDAKFRNVGYTVEEAAVLYKKSNSK